MLNLTKQKALEEHRKMWNWIADKTWKQKRKVKKFEYFKCNSEYREFDIENDCFCCEFDYYKNNDCYKCPIEWNDKYCTELNSYYTLWIKSKNYMFAAYYARKIANLPENFFRSNY